MKGQKRVMEKEAKESNGLIWKMVISKNIGIFFLVKALNQKNIVNKLMPWNIEIGKRVKNFQFRLFPYFVCWKTIAST